MLVADFVIEIATADDVVAAVDVGQRHDRACVASALQADLCPTDLKELLLSVKRVVVLVGASGRLVYCRQRAERDASRGPAQLRAEDRIDDRARVDGIQHAGVALSIAGQVENAGALHEERPLLGEVHREALIHLDLEGVALHLAEVRVDRRVERDRGREAVLRADANVARAIPFPCGRRRADGGLRQRGGGNDLARRNAVQILEGQRGMFFEDPFAGLERGPGHRHACPAHPAPEQDAHAHVVAAPEADSLQRQLDFDDVARIGETSGALPDPVGRRVLVARDRVDHVELDTARVHHEVIARLPSALRVEAQPHPVVRPDVVAPRDRGLDARWLRIVAAEGEIERAVVVRHPDRGLLRDLVAAQRVVGQPRAGWQRRAGPRLVIEHAVDHGRPADARGFREWPLCGSLRGRWSDRTRERQRQEHARSTRGPDADLRFQDQGSPARPAHGIPHNRRRRVQLLKSWHDRIRNVG